MMIPILDTHTNIYRCPHTSTGRSNSSVPLDEVGSANIVPLGDNIASVSRLDEVELLASTDHTRLSRLRSCHAAGVLCRSWCRSYHLGRLMADDGDTSVCIGPETAAGASNIGVPGAELSCGNAILSSNVGTCVTADDEVKLVTVADHVWLSRLGSLDTITLGRCWGRSRYWRGVLADDAHTGIGISPKTTASAANIGIPGAELCQRDAKFLGDGSTLIAGLHKVELVTVGNKVWLSGKRSLDTISSRLSR